jgi:hypothetical protein
MRMGGMTEAHASVLERRAAPAKCIRRERRFSSAYGLTSMHCAPLRLPSSHEESSVLVRRVKRCALNRCEKG